MQQKKAANFIELAAFGLYQSPYSLVKGEGISCICCNMILYFIHVFYSFISVIH